MKIVSIFLSVDGEVNFCGVGSWSVFIRFAGCSATCNYCDSKYTWGRQDAKNMILQEVIKEVERIGQGVKKITITGGEPFEQRAACEDVMFTFLKAGYMVSVETNGFHWINQYAGKNPNLGFVMDYKLPSAGTCSQNTRIERFMNLSQNDYIKFPIGSKIDFDIAVNAVEVLYPLTQAHMYFSPIHNKIKPYDLFLAMKKINLPPFQVGINLQMHKFIFPDDWRIEEKNDASY